MEKKGRTIGPHLAAILVRLEHVKCPQETQAEILQMADKLKGLLMEAGAVGTVALDVLVADLADWRLEERNAVCRVVGGMMDSWTTQN